MKTRVVTFNVCGVKGLLSRAAQWVPDRTLAAMFDALDADIVCLQETKVQLNDMPKDLAIVPGYTSVFTSVRGRPGYDGVAIYVRNTMRIYRAEEGLTGWLRPRAGDQPYRLDSNLSVLPGMYPQDISEQEGLQIDAQQARALTLDLGVCVLIGLYCPADSQGNMPEYKDRFFQLLDWRVHQLRLAGREVVVLGDLNVAREPIDSAPIVEELTRLKQPIDREQWMFANVPRSAVNNWMVNEGFTDTCRQFHPSRARMFTCWDQQKNCRPANFGSRIDYILCSEGLHCVSADILSDLVGSDHCPVYAEFEFGELLPQKGHALPPLARRVVDKWPKSIAFFLKRGRDRDSSPGQKLLKTKETEGITSGSPRGTTGNAIEAASDPRSISREASQQSSIYESLPKLVSANETSSDSRRDNSGDVAVFGSEKADEIVDKAGEERTKSSTEKDLKNQVNSNDYDDLEVASEAGRNASESSATSLSTVQSVSPTKPKAKQASIAAMFGAKNPQWHAVSRKSAPPLCKHGQPCIMMKSNKPPRKGEWFWVCSRPMGGRINSGLEYRCKTFIWDVDRKPSSS